MRRSVSFSFSSYQVQIDNQHWFEWRRRAKKKCHMLSYEQTNTSFTHLSWWTMLQFFDDNLRTLTQADWMSSAVDISLFAIFAKSFDSYKRAEALFERSMKNVSKIIKHCDIFVSLSHFASISSRYKAFQVYWCVDLLCFKQCDFMVCIHKN